MNINMQAFTGACLHKRLRRYLNTSVDCGQLGPIGYNRHCRLDQIGLATIRASADE